MISRKGFKGKGKKSQAKHKAKGLRRAKARKEKRDRRRRSGTAGGDTAAERFESRCEAFDERFGRWGVLWHTAAWCLHNCVAHPLLGIAPGRPTVWLHDLTATWLNLGPAPEPSPLPDIQHRWRWVLHNCVAHPVMGLAPLSRWFDWHEHTAEQMAVADWA